MLRFEHIWRDQCIAAQRIQMDHGFIAALDYLIGEKLDRFLQTAATRPEFARELPSFVSDIRQLFSRGDIAAYFTLIEDDAKRSSKAPGDKHLVEAGLLMSSADKTARLERLKTMKAMLLADQLGTA